MDCQGNHAFKPNQNKCLAVDNVLGDPNDNLTSMETSLGVAW